MIPIPKIALVGRANVGKSTLFNRICGRRQAITDGRPGSTRDRNYAHASWRGRVFELIDTGGLLLGQQDALLAPAEEQVFYAIAESALVIFVVDGRSGLLPDDIAIAKQLRKEGKQVVVAVNKMESQTSAEMEFTRLGFEHVMAISAEHGQGIGEILDFVDSALPHSKDEDVEPAAPTEPFTRLSLVGRPNVGKSALLNRLIGSKRAVVSPVPGTTRDATDTEVVIDGHRYCFVDTAGIRRRRLLKETVDHVSVLQARRSIRRADVAALVIDATEGVRELDIVVSNDVREMARGAVIVVNKWDGARAQKRDRRSIENDVREQLHQLSFAPMIFTSALTGFGMRAFLESVVGAHEASRRRVTTGLLNRVLARAVEANPLKTVRKSDGVRLLYATQVGVAPPTFILAINRPVELHFSYKRYLENQLREEFDLKGAAIVIKVHCRPH